MIKKPKRLFTFGLLLFFSVVVVGLGLKYFPFTKVMKLRAGSEKEFVNPQKIKALSPHTLFYDFEIAVGKETPGGFYKGLAHSGQYSVKAFGQNSFSIAVERTAGEAGIENLKAVALSAWIYVFPTKNEVKGNFVFTASDEAGKTICWQGVSLNGPEIPRGKWFKISGNFDLSPVSFKPADKIKVYFWNNSHTDILIDDYNVVFGGAAERRGDSSWVDLTRTAAYTPRLNFPPFPVLLLEKENLNSLPKPAEIGPFDVVAAGNFLNSGSEGLLIIKPNGTPAAYAFCRTNRSFRKITLNNPSALAAVGHVKKIITGKFLPVQGDEFLVCGDKGWILASLDPVANACGGSEALMTNIKILYTSVSPETSVFAGDFNGDHRSEILLVTGNGSWQLMSAEQTGSSPIRLQEIARDRQSPVKEWDRNNQDISLSTGLFLPNSAPDQVLTVTRGKGQAKCTWSIRKLNLSRMTWDPQFSEKQNYCGKTIGLDTLKPADILIAGNGPVVIRYNRDWRFDLKEIRFNDTTFTIMASFDFHGYDLDHNPKYYESLALIPGHFLNESEISFLAVGHIARERQYDALLPDFIDLYSIPKKK